MLIGRRLSLISTFLSILLLSCSSQNNNSDVVAKAKTFTETYAPVIQTAANGSITFEQLIANNAADPVTTLIQTLNSGSSIRTAELSIDGSTVLATTKDGVSFAIMTDEKNRSQWTTANVVKPISSLPLALEQSSFETPVRFCRDRFLPQILQPQTISCDETNFPQSKEACLVMSFQTEFQQDTSKLTAPLQRAGYSPKILSLKTPADLATLQKQLPNCGVIYVSSHGNVRKTFNGTYSNVITTELEAFSDKDKLQTDFIDLIELFGDKLFDYLTVDAHGGKAYWSLTPAFFAQFTYKNAFVYIDACNSTRDLPTGGSSLSSAFQTKGAGAFIGWDGSISTRFSNPVAEAIFDGLAPETASITSVTISTSPPDPGPHESYIPSAQLSPALEGVEVSISVSGTDGFSRSETKNTDASGVVIFSSIPGGEGGVTDTITVVAGGADSGATVINVVKKDPVLNAVWTLPWNPAQESLSQLSYSANGNYNLVCNNQAVVEEKTVIKF